MFRLSLCLVLLLALGCGPSPDAGSSNYGYPEYGAVPEFKDIAPANATPADDLTSLPFTDPDGKPVDLNQYHGKKNVVLVFTRGLTATLDPAAANNAGSICVYCATQTSRIAANYPEFEKRDAEVVIVFPIVKAIHAARLGQFETAVKSASTEDSPKIPFPIVLDLELKAVDHLGIRRDLSKPSTFILDKQGKVQYAYVGANLVDRPSVKAMLAQLDRINGEK